jgi:selenocysteine-specific elongation factor
MPLTVGTAGHIDHGKTWLVRALTGKDTDRLPEERRRGISIDLGYAPLELPDGRRLSLVDVPGHERFVRAMVAGATGIDLFLLVIDAGEGARPQTLEHLAILRLLGVERGVVAVTKADAVDAETLELALEEARELVPGAEVVAVSAKTGVGLDQLRAAIGRAADGAAPAHGSSATRLYVDRVFTLRGIGTVVTGTLWSGGIADGDVLRAEPGGREVRVRSLEVHDMPVSRAEAGQRVAVSLPGVERRELRRGDALVSVDAYPVSYRLDVALHELEPIEDGEHVTVHHGTGHVAARVARIGERWAQLRLANPVVAARGDRVVLRRDTTVGGGTVLDPAPPRHRDTTRIALVERGEIAATIHSPVRVSDLRHLLDGDPQGVERADEWVFSRTWLEELRAELRRKIAAADPLDPGTPIPSEPWAAAVVPLLGLERRGSMLYEPGAAGQLGARAAEVAELERRLDQAGLAATKVDDAELARFLESREMLVRLGGGYAVGAGGYQVALDVLVTECQAAGEITLARFRDLAGVGRRDAQLLLERFDADGITRRDGERRVLRRGASQAAGLGGSRKSSTESGSTPSTTAS